MSFEELLEEVRKALGMDKTAFETYLRVVNDEERKALCQAVEDEFGFNAEWFRKEVEIYLIMKARPYISRDDINFKNL